jgi:two-component system response regulator YesN
LFKKEVGIGFVDYVGGVRLEEAKKMLIDSNVKVKEVAESVGFVDPHYFGIWFKENTGLSPSQYRKTMWVNKLEA